MTWMTKEAVQALRESVPFQVSRDELVQINKEATRRWRRERRFRWTLLVMSPVGLLAVFFGKAAFPLNPRLAFTLGWVFLVVAGFAFIAATRARYSHHLRRVLRQRGYEVCEGCGYALAALGPDVLRCPECGSKRIPISQ